MTSTAESARWYDNPRLGASPNTGGSSHQSGGVDASDMGAFYALENAGHRRYYSTGYAPHGKNQFFVRCVSCSSIYEITKYCKTICLWQSQSPKGN